MKNYLRLKKMHYIVALAAISIVLALIEIPWFIITGPFASFVKLDFSEIAILVALLVLGPKETIGVILLRTVARRLFRGFELGDVVGEMLAMFASFSIVTGYLLVRKVLGQKERPLLYEVSIGGNRLEKKEWIASLVIIPVVLAFVLFLINFLFATPLYLSIFGVSMSASLHFTVFSFVPDSPFTMTSFLWATFASYTPFNLVKGLLVTAIFLLIKPRMKYLEL
jgi:riboflavin transporter